RHPEGKLVELWPGFHRFIKRRDFIRVWFVGVVSLDLLVYLSTQLFGISEIAVQVDFSKQKRQVLEILPDDRFVTSRDPPLVKLLGMPHYVLVVLQQQFSRQFCQIEKLSREGVVEA